MIISQKHNLVSYVFGWTRLHVHMKDRTTFKEKGGWSTSHPPTHLGRVAPEPTLLCSGVGGVMAIRFGDAGASLRNLHAAAFLPSPVTRWEEAQGLLKGFRCAFSSVIRFFSLGE